MSPKSALVSGSCGLIGSEVCSFFARQGFRIVGIDSNHRAVFFGPEGDTTWVAERLRRDIPGYRHETIDIRDREALLALVCEVRPDLIIHTAAQPSHDRAASIPFLDFEVNALGTLHMLEGARQYCPESPFIHMSTNKVYGDRPNTLTMHELETRWDYADPAVSQWHPGGVFNRPKQALTVRRIEGGGGCDGAGVRPLLQHAHLLPPRRLPHRAESLGCRVAWISELPRQMQY